ncbi:hypothetical protein BAUCODRAFT_120059 [Baudoinia panamericana UAMH 10762]|uniref:FAD-binding domain-containing protein n=1 Tax=Baudoinia panamericana (strain UAMH 10762) TaxID=717646 RepID=M2NHD3_BAUPA|nr:uncharacterized protein BAUCODRAFT_120059 [Baudoinia panamericana UAMH 10762]EMC98754.1 hypothetical protein BAUCODRAFT_120059 [Baudoinia panamericana UAMH 10762]
MAAALGLIKAGHQVVVYERYSHARPAGSILNLWPPPIKALEDMGVDIKEIGAGCSTSFWSSSGVKRCEVKIPTGIGAEYGGGFVGLLRPDLYSRMLDALPKDTIKFNHNVTEISDKGDNVLLTFADGTKVETPVLIGADGIESFTRRYLWGPQDKRPHNLFVYGGYTLHEDFNNADSEVRIIHSPTTQCAVTAIKSKGRRGVQWWFVEGWPDDKPVPESGEQVHQRAVKQAAESFPTVADVVRKTPATQTQIWKIRDLKPIPHWSKGRITLAGDAAHATSPYAAYGAGMSICDGYFLGQLLHGVELSDKSAVSEALVQYERCRMAHTYEQVNLAYFNGQFFHHTPWYLRFFRDALLNWTPFMQWVVGDRNANSILAQLDEMGDGILKPAPHRVTVA